MEGAKKGCYAEIMVCIWSESGFGFVWCDRLKITVIIDGGVDADEDEDEDDDEDEEKRATHRCSSDHHLPYK